VSCPGAAVTLAEGLSQAGLPVSVRSSADAVGSSPAVVAVTSGRGAAHAAQVAALAARAGTRLVVVGVGAPYELREFPQVSTYLVTYGPDTPSLRAAAKVLTGQIRPAGRLPVSVPGLYPRGHRVDL
jgi:beta-N-acetylhexosaminidase